MDEIVFRPSEGKFSKVRCNKCRNEQVIFTKASTEVRCLVCNEVLAKPTGGKAEILAEVIENYS